MEFFPSKKAWAVWWLLPWPILLKKERELQEDPGPFLGSIPRGEAFVDNASVFRFSHFMCQRLKLTVICSKTSVRLVRRIIYLDVA